MINWIGTDTKPEYNIDIILFREDKYGNPEITQGHFYSNDYFYDLKDNHFDATHWAELTDINLPE